MPTVDLKSQLSKLVELQAIDSQMHALRAEKASKPQAIKEIEAAFEAKKQHLAEIEKKSLDIQKARKEKELESGTKNESVVKLKGQLYSLKTNKEYQTMLHQIQDGQADASVIEDKILELMVQSDAIKVELDQEKNKIKEEEKVFAGQKKIIEDRIREIDEALAKHETQRKQIIPDIDPKILIQYERILPSRDGLAIVTVKHETCGGCNMTTPPQVVNLIKMYERIITCEVCNRMLYVEE